MEGQRLAFEVITPAPSNPAQSPSRVEIEDEREVRQDPARGSDVQVADEVEIHPAAVALVRHGGVGVTVAEHDPPLSEPRPQLVGHVLLAGGEEEEDLTQCGET